MRDVNLIANLISWFPVLSVHNINDADLINLVYALPVANLNSANLITQCGWCVILSYPCTIACVSCVIVGLGPTKTWGGGGGGEGEGGLDFPENAGMIKK